MLLVSWIWKLVGTNSYGATTGKENQTVKEKIDKILINFEWRLLYLNAEAIAIPPISSGHSPLVLCLKPEGSSQHLFRFEAFWQDHEQCQSVIQESWKSSAHEDGKWGQLLSSVKNCTRGLSRWSRTTFKQADKEVHKLKKRLMDLSNGPDSHSNKTEMEEIRKEIDKHWKQEEKYWGMRSRIKWIQWGDKNTKFFHSTTLQEGTETESSESRIEEGNGLKAPK
ncbi:hypothetical protein SESBI_14457 [Sesbania bispinosa]|nr:hypothetical protein SESBI_14457 [Sesbania bispinosa]